MRSVASVRPALRGRGAEPRAADSPNAPPALRQKGLPLSPHGGHGGHASPLPPPGQERPSAGGNAALLRPACPPRPGLAAGMPQRPGTRPRNLPAATPQRFSALPARFSPFRRRVFPPRTSFSRGLPPPFSAPERPLAGKKPFRTGKVRGIARFFSKHATFCLRLQRIVLRLSLWPHGRVGALKLPPPANNDRSLR